MPAQQRDAANQDTCYYDAQCGLCRRSTRNLRRLDWLGNLRFEDMGNAGVNLPIPYERAVHEGMPMRTAGGRTLVGFPAIRRALARTPLGWPVAMLLYIPGVDTLGRLVYRWVATHRDRDACELQSR